MKVENRVKNEGKDLRSRWESAAKWKERLTQRISSDEYHRHPQEGIDLSWLNQYIHEMIDSSLPHMGDLPAEKKMGHSAPGAKQETTHRIHYTLYEIFGFTIVRVPLPEEVEPGQVKIWADSHELILSMSEELKEKIRLPVKVVASESRAYYRDRMIEIRLREDPELQHVEIPMERI